MVYVVQVCWQFASRILILLARGMNLQEAGEKWVMRSCIICIVTRCYSDDVKEDGMDSG